MCVTQLIFTSAASREFEESEAREILAATVHRNRAKRLSGVLLYSQGNFLQVLEGPKEVILETLGRIRQDRRHHSIIELSLEDVDQPEFKDWFVGYRRCSDPISIPLPGFVPAFDPSFRTDAITATPGTASKIVADFALTN